MNSEIIVIHQEVGKKAQLQKIKNEVYEFKKLIGGEIEIIPYDDVVIICKKIRERLKPNIYITTKFLNIGETIRGNIIIVCIENGDFKSLTKEKAIKYMQFLKNASFNYNNVDENGKFISAYNTKYLNLATKDKTLNDNNNISKNQNEEILRMILGIQTVILKYIKNNID